MNYALTRYLPILYTVYYEVQPDGELKSATNKRIIH